MAIDVLKSGKDSVRRFIIESLMPRVTDLHSETKVNVEKAFREFLEKEGAPSVLASEYSNKWNTELLNELYRHLDEWEQLGLPRPIDMSGSGTTFVTWRHKLYAELTGRPTLPEAFADVSGWVSGQKERRFLLVCVCILKIAGANPIYVTDMSGDGGVDVLGFLPDGLLKSTCLFVQAKSSSSAISREVVLTEFGKFTALRSTPKFLEYLSAAGSVKAIDGASFCYMFLSNNEFKWPAREVARQLGVLLRSRRQIAFWLSKSFTLKELTELENEVGKTLSASLSDNLAERITLQM